MRIGSVRVPTLVVQEGGLPGPATGYAHDLAECARVAQGELVLVADNRLGYKRSAGAHGAFHVLGPLEYTGAAAAPRRGEKSLWGYRRALAAAGFERAEAYSLYPHSGQFVHVVALDRPRPRRRRNLGARERRPARLPARVPARPEDAQIHAGCSGPMGATRADHDSRPPSCEEARLRSP